PDNPYASSFRFAGGVQVLVDALAKIIPEEAIELEKTVTEIHLEKNNMTTVVARDANGNKEEIHARGVILALPSRIVAHHITFYPSLPSALMTNLISKPTWMAGQAKVVAIYDRPFWREAGLSGFVSSWIGPLQEIHDASPKIG